MSVKTIKTNLICILGIIILLFPTFMCIKSVAAINDFANSNCDKLSENDPFNLLNEYWFYSSKELLIILNDIY